MHIFKTLWLTLIISLLAIPSFASSVSYPFVVVDNTGNYVSGATIQIGATTLVANTPASVNVKALSTGNTISAVSVTYQDFGDGGYALIYDPANGEAHISLNVSKSGVSISGPNATLFLTCTLDSSLVTAISTRTALALPAAAPNASGGLLTYGTGTGQLNPASGTFTSGSVTTVASGTAQTGTGTSITLQVSGSSTVTDLYKGNFVVISSGTGAGQSRVISAYNGGTLVATVSRAWTVNPDATSLYSVIANPHPAMDSNLAVVASSVTGAVGSITGITFPSNFGTFSIDGNGKVVLTPGEHTAIAADVLNATASSYNTAGSIGNKINSAASAGDPWNTALPGSYASGTAGNILGNRLDAAISSRLATGGYTAPPTTSQIAAVILSNPSNLIATDGSGNVSLSTTLQNAIRDAVWAKVMDGSLTAQDVMVMQAAGMVGTVSNTFNTGTHTLTTLYKRQDGTTTAYGNSTVYGNLATAPGVQTRTGTIGTLP
jgi:hypothetical protein